MSRETISMLEEIWRNTGGDEGAWRDSNTILILDAQQQRGNRKATVALLAGLALRQKDLAIAQRAIYLALYLAKKEKLQIRYIVREVAIREGVTSIV